MENKKKFNWKAFVSLSLSCSFIIIFITGIILYLAPAGRIAYWVNWKLLGLDKEQWQALHTVFSYTFATFSIIHLFSLNWKTFWAYIVQKSSKQLNKTKEIIWALSISAVILTGTLVGIPPFSSIMDFGTYLTSSWENKDKEAPVPHAERLTIPKLVEKLDGYTTEQVLNRLKNNQIIVGDIALTLQEIADVNGKSPIELYEIITYKPANDMAGTGIGRKSLEEVAAMKGKDVNEMIRKLEKNNIKANKSKSIKDIATENNMPAKKIFEIIMQ